jgi:stage V sporulation protein D (sporulation-specific penicillin-binding protein)
MGAASLLALVLVMRLTYWQVIEHDRIALLAGRQHHVTFKLPAHRGRVLDRSGQILATDTPVYNVVGDPALIPTQARPATAQALAPLLGIDQNELLDKLALPIQFEYLKHKVSKETADKVRLLQLGGIALEDDVQRSYLVSADAPPPGAGAVAAPPNPPPGSTLGIVAVPGIMLNPIPARSLGSNLLGFVNDDGAGQYGVEQYYNFQLHGRDGYESSLKTGANQTIVLSDRKRVEPRNGEDVVLSIDSQVQFVAEKTLAEAVQKTGAEKGAVIAMETSTGNIVAWADYPTFDANHFGGSDTKLFSDSIASGLYEPGSVMKVVTMSSALDTGAVTPDYTINDPGSVSIGGFNISDWDPKPKGNIDMTEVIRHSWNVGAVKVEQKEGGSSFYHYLDLFGIGKLTGIDVANEVVAYRQPLNNVHASELATMSFGQGVAVTPIEMISAINTVASGGRYVKPRVATAMIDPDGKRNDLAPDPGRQVLSLKATQEMRAMMVQVVESGSGFKAQIPGWKERIAGKTGTANVPDKGRYTDQTIASFTGFMPVDNPRFTLMVVIWKPKGDGAHIEGSLAAAPAWRVVAQDILQQWQITP